ncbi:MAG: sugar transporter ATP-binding protein [Tardiphaga sp.]|nr:sugar transporter ATP-binding protein [Tardiphaga sp.]
MNVLAQMPDAAGASVPLFELRGISKSFPGVKALDDVSFVIRPGEVHMLLGENGAGKSSLMKVLCGAYSADGGEFFLNGSKVEIRSAADARRLGIAVIFQEFSLVPYLDIAQNIYLGREPKGRIPGTIDRRKILRDAKTLLQTIGFDIDPSTPVHKLGVAQQQMVEIAKALSQDARILVMDEPTAALSDRETELLFAVIAQLKAKGVAIVYISHRMAEVFSLGDRITVLRDGKRVGEARPGQSSPDELIRLMVGRNVDTSYPRDFAAEPGAVVLEVSNVSASSGIRDINLVVRAGEIVGLCGLVGSGRTEVARAIFGADRIAAGEIRVDGQLRSGGPDKASRLGIALIPESRKAEGLALIRSVGDNLVVSALRRLFPLGLFVPQKAREVSGGLVRQLRVATPSTKQPVGLLSGGNQQKVVIGKWLAAGAKVFIFDEPTRGIDVGAKAEIFALIDDLVARGAAVLMISSEQVEIVHVCDRAYVMRDGRIVGELSRHELSEENIVRLGMHHA